MRCIFCKEPSNSSKSVEHVIPESIGSKRVILPPGVVCDKCNNYFARKVEHPVLNHQSMRNLRAWYQVPNKKGKAPSLQGEIAGTDIGIALRLTKDGQIEIQPEKESQRAIFEQVMRKNATDENDFSPYIFPIQIDPPQMKCLDFFQK